MIIHDYTVFSIPQNFKKKNQLKSLKLQQITHSRSTIQTKAFQRTVSSHPRGNLCKVQSISFQLGFTACLPSWRVFPPVMVPNLYCQHWGANLQPQDPYQTVQTRFSEGLHRWGSYKRSCGKADTFHLSRNAKHEWHTEQWRHGNKSTFFGRA